VNDNSHLPTFIYPIFYFTHGKSMNNHRCPAAKLTGLATPMYKDELIFDLIFWMSKGQRMFVLSSFNRFHGDVSVFIINSTFMVNGLIKK